MTTKTLGPRCSGAGMGTTEERRGPGLGGGGDVVLVGEKTEVVRDRGGGKGRRRDAVSSAGGRPEENSEGGGRNWSGVEPPLSLQPRLPHGLHRVTSCQVRACGQWPAALSQCSSPCLPGWGQGCGIRAVGSGLYRPGSLRRLSPGGQVVACIRCSMFGLTAL